MTQEMWVRRLSSRGLLALLLMLGLVFWQPAMAQDEAAEEGQAELAENDGGESEDPATEEAEADAETEEADLFTEADLDTLVAPYALYPDTLLAQVFMASTYPLDVVKADRWVDENKELEGTDRSEAAEGEDWDASVAVLAAGFPSVIEVMNDDIDSTEDLGNALLAQDDDVFDAVQRQRARAAAVGNLESNEAQVVETENDVITVAPADPEVVYVPTYDTTQVYTTAPPAQTVVVEENSGSDTGALIATGLLSFGAGMLVNEIFDDDDPWDDYWRGPPRFDWDDDRFYPRPGVNVDGDVNIDVDRNNIDIDRDGAWRPNNERRDDARDKIRDRKGDGKLADRKRDGNLAAADRSKLTNRDSSRNKLDQKLKARSKGDGGKLGQASSKRKVSAGGAKKSLKSNNALKSTRKGTLSGAKKASNRGKASKQRSSRSKPTLKRSSSTRKASASKSRRSSSALKKNRGGGHKAKASKSRGSKSRGRKKRR